MEPTFGQMKRFIEMVVEGKITSENFQAFLEKPGDWSQDQKCLTPSNPKVLKPGEYAEVLMGGKLFYLRSVTVSRHEMEWGCRNSDPNDFDGYRRCSNQEVPHFFEHISDLPREYHHNTLLFVNDEESYTVVRKGIREWQMYVQKCGRHTMMGYDLYVCQRK